MTEFLIAKRIFDDDEKVKWEEPELRISEVPEGTTPRDIKDTLKQSGYEYQWGLYTLVPSQWWIDAGDDDDSFSDSQSRSINIFAAPDISYEELLDKINDEKRITLRLPVGLHVALSRAAGFSTLNSYCLKVLADKVDYSDKLEGYEKKLNKPGRPKKVRDSE